jgi:hypothetical protein
MRSLFLVRLNIRCKDPASHVDQRSREDESLLRYAFGRVREAEDDVGWCNQNGNCSLRTVHLHRQSLSIFTCICGGRVLWLHSNETLAT